MKQEPGDAPAIEVILVFMLVMMLSAITYTCSLPVQPIP